MYKYPQQEFPYADLVRVNGERGLEDPEYELEDTGAFAAALFYAANFGGLFSLLACTGIFDDDAYWDVTAEYAKDGPNDIYIR